MQIILIAAQSLDGFITRHDIPGTAFTSEADKRYFRQVLEQFDASICGGNTYRVDRALFLGSLQPGRRRVVLTRQPKAFAADERPSELEFTNEDPAILIARLRHLGHIRCALLGGSQIHQHFLQAGLVDEVWLTLEPRLFGRGTPLISGQVDVNLSLLSHELLGGDTLLVKYRPALPANAERNLKLET